MRATKIPLFTHIGEFIVNNKNTSFTPSYDLVNIEMFPQFKHVLAMGMGEEFDPIDINAYQLADFAEACGINKKLLARLLSELSRKVQVTLSEAYFLRDLIESNKFDKDELTYLGKLKNSVLSRTEHLSSQSSLIHAIEV